MPSVQRRSNSVTYDAQVFAIGAEARIPEIEVHYKAEDGSEGTAKSAPFALSEKTCFSKGNRGVWEATKAEALQNNNLPHLRKVLRGCFGLPQPTWAPTGNFNLSKF